MKTQNKFDTKENLNNWLYVQQKQQEKKQAKQMRNMKQSRKGMWNSAE